MKKRIVLIGLISVALTVLTSFSETYESSVAGNEILIAGTSNLHSWNMAVVASNCVAEFDIEGLQLKSIRKVDFSCKTRDIKSNNNLMDRKTYEAIKADNHPEIRFTLTEGSVPVTDGRNFSGTLRGRLNVAGFSREVSVPFTGTLNANNTILVKGSVDLKMTDFKIDPPTALLGTLKTGDLVTVTFSLNLFNKS